jgi:hypothetical protein
MQAIRFHLVRSLKFTRSGATTTQAALFAATNRVSKP